MRVALRRSSSWLAALTLAAVAGCTSDATEPASDSGGEAQQQSGQQGTVLQPGSPGEGNQTLSPGATPVPESEHNDVDVQFMQMMIPHHAQAVEMGDLADTRARDEQVTSLAQRIADAQQAEIRGMSGWLEARNLDVPKEDAGGHAMDHHHDKPGEAMMDGMLSPAEMDELAAADGARFDELYLQGMIRHHRGAIDMAAKVMDSGSDVVVGELAADISAGQAAEIDRMRQILRRLD